MGEARWELHDGKAQIGPLEEAHVIRMIGAGLPATTMVRPEGREKWKPVGSHMPFAEAMSRSEPAQAPPSPAPKVVAVERVPFVGWGCLVQLLGIGVAASVAVGLFALGARLIALAGGGAVLVLFLAWGRNVSAKWSCGACKNPLASRDVRLCPVCKADLG